jgi:hypothetical protein
MKAALPPGLKATPATYSCSDVSMIWKRAWTPVRIVLVDAKRFLDLPLRVKISAGP